MSNVSLDSSTVSLDASTVSFDASISNDDTSHEDMEFEDEDDDDEGESVSTLHLDKAMDMVAMMLLELREKYKTTNKATNFIAEKISHILNIDRKLFREQFIDSTKRHDELSTLGYESTVLLESESVFSIAFSHFVGDKSLTNYIESKEDYVKPVTTNVVSETGENVSIEYVPLEATLQSILSNEYSLRLILNSEQYLDGRLRNYCDGELYKKNKLFQKEPNALQIILYHDDFTVVNPIGNKTADHKESAFYFQIGNIPMKHRSKLSDIHLLTVFPAKLIKSHGYKSVLRPLISDLQRLESGIEFSIDGLPSVVYGTVTMVIADNLAAHAIAGHFCNFSTVQRFCRFCQTLKSNINTDLNPDEFLLRTVEGHQKKISEIGLGLDWLKSVYGIVKDCCLNTLQYFHSVNGFPPDLAHDLLEGFAKSLLQMLMISFIRDKYLTISKYNDIVNNFEYSEVDKKNKPQPIKPPKALDELKFRETACEVWNLLRLFPLFVGNIIPETDLRWLLYLEFLDIVERLTAISFNDEELLVLKDSINEFFPRLLKIYPLHELKPKEDFLLHYPLMIRKYGPLVKTLRFESKNGILKEGVLLTKNHKNIPYSMAKRHQMGVYLSRHTEDEDRTAMKPKFIYAQETPFNSIKDELRNVITEQFSTMVNEVVFARGVYVGGCRYSEDEAVVLGYDADGDKYIFGVIIRSIHVANKVALHCREANTFYNRHYHAYEIVDLLPKHIVVDVENLLDHHPLGTYQVDGKLLITLHHYVPEY